MKPQVGQALIRAIDFLGRQQDITGVWYDFPLGTGYGSAWPTAFVGFHLSHVSPGQPYFHAATGHVARARLWLLSHITAAGGWGFSERLPEDADSTALGLLFLQALKAPEARAVALKAFTTIHQWEDGGVGTYNPNTIRVVAGQDPFFPGSAADFPGWTGSVPSVTAAMALAWAEHPEEWDTAVRARQYLASQQHEDGAWRDYWWLQPHYPTYMAVSALKGSDQDSFRIEKALRWLESTQSEDGGWPFEPISCNAFATALAVITFCVAGQGSSRAAALGIEWLLRHQDSDGGFPPGAVMVIPPAELTTPPTGLARLFLPQVLDQRRLFTSATVVRACAEYLNGLN